MPSPKKGYYLNNNRLVSTTTIISRFKDSSRLLVWAFNQGKEGKASLYSERDEKAAIGTVAHLMIETYLREGKDKFDCLCEQKDCVCSVAYRAFESYLKWEESNKIKIIVPYQEVSLVSEEYRFGGTPDAVGELNGVPVLLDWKTSNGVYIDYLLQLAAYVHLVNDGVVMETGKPLGIKLKNEAYLLRVLKDTPGFSYHYFGDLSLAWEQFKLFRRAYDIDNELKKHL